jgi:hypothetical protein
MTNKIKREMNTLHILYVQLIKDDGLTVRKRKKDQDYFSKTVTEYAH